MKLRHDPYQAFAGDRSPVSLRVRMDFMGEHGCAFTAEKLATNILVSQKPDGSWGDCAATIKALYELSLLNPGGNLITRTGVRWLLEEDLPPMARKCPDGASYDGLFFRMGKYESPKLNGLVGTPFTKGCSGFIKTGAALYLASANRLHAHERVASALESLAQVAEVRGGRWCNPSCSNNILQGYAVHPDAKDSAAMRKAVARIGELQKPSGAWTGAPFYPTLFALSNCDYPKATKQVRLALGKCARTQRKDGTWGTRKGLHDAYMVLESMRRTGDI